MNDTPRMNDTPESRIAAKVQDPEFRSRLKRGEMGDAEMLEFERDLILSGLPAYIDPPVLRKALAEPERFAAIVASGGRLERAPHFDPVTAAMEAMGIKTRRAK